MRYRTLYQAEGLRALGYTAEVRELADVLPTLSGAMLCRHQYVVLHRVPGLPWTTA